jgi:uncharacterized protein (TIGR02246 family)
MMPGQIEAIIAQARASWLTGDAASFANAFVSEGEFIVPGQRWVGREAIQQVAAEFAASHTVLEISIQNVVFGEDQAVVEWRWKDIENRTGTETVAEDAIVIAFQAGQVQRWREYIDAKSPRAREP